MSDDPTSTPPPGNGPRVVRMVERGAGVPTEDLRGWLQSYAMAESLNPEKAKSVLLVVERMDGSLAFASQSLSPLDGYRLAGLVSHLQHRILHGHVGGDL